ncbi:MAG: UbiA family prenyltransferase [Alphaproteobacteria bacterium]|nr:UbiA family prenyltransferase [Alphaproteobacteria bacterium]
MNLHPLIVDLDGTLIRTDMLHESALKAVRSNPFVIFLILYYLFFKGKAKLKQYLSAQSNFDPSTLPYDMDLLNWLKNQRNIGRKLILCTASDLSIANSIAKHLGIFQEVIASDGVINLAGKNKAKALEQRFGHAGFDYAGNSNADLFVWKKARHAIVVNGSSGLAKKAAKNCEVKEIFSSHSLGIGVWLRVLRVHQWLKNALLFIPFFAGHQIFDSETWFSLILAFFSFSLCASSVYIINDLLDLDSDRQHPRKCKRPFASGIVPAWMGIILAPLLFLISLGLAQYVNGDFVPWLMVYFILTCAYSFKLKQIVLIDCITLAMLYTLRVIAGTAAAGLGMSFWLLAFSIFLFLSLAFVKRYAELEVQILSGKEKIAGRGYFTSDAPLIRIQGLASGYVSVLVLALYLQSDDIIRLYAIPELIWATVPIILYWVSWMWMQAHRGNMHDDPLVFAVKDKASLITGVVFSIVLIIGAVGWPW